MKKIWLVLLGVGLVLGGLFLYAKISANATKLQEIQVGTHFFLVEVAQTSAEREKGLSGHHPLNSNQGMLFIYPTPGIYSFWMNEMRFAIDIVWISENKRIINITRNVSPTTYPQTFKPPSPVQFVLEIPAGSADEYQLQIGNQLKLP